MPAVSYIEVKKDDHNEINRMNESKTREGAGTEYIDTSHLDQGPAQGT